MLNEEGNNVNNNNIRSLFYKKSNESKSTQNIFDVCRKKCEEKKIEMHFLPDVYVPCEVCKGKRYNHETFYKKKSPTTNKRNIS